MAKQRKHHVLKIVLVIVVVLVCAGALGIHVYASDYYHALPEAIEAEASTDSVQVHQLDNGDVTLVPADDVRAAFVFYPGGKVEAEAYLPLLKRLAKNDIACVLVKMPENLAVLAPNRADRGRVELDQALETSATSDSGTAGDAATQGTGESSDAAGDGTAQNPDDIPWMIGGHSLGGAMAASYAAGHTANYQGLVLLAAYSTSDLTNSGIKVLSVYGSNDGVLNRDSYQKDFPNLPQDTTEYVIDGGIHSYFGVYGHQEGDGEAAISNDEQLDLTANAIAAFAGEL